MMDLNNLLQSLEVEFPPKMFPTSAIKMFKDKLKLNNPDVFLKWKRENFDINFGFTCEFEKEFQNYTLLYLCSGLCLPYFVECLLEDGADPKCKSSKSPLIVAAKKGFNEIVILLLNHGADINVHVLGKTPLHFAASEGHSETVKTLIRYKSHINASDVYDDTALTLALRKNKFNTTKLLIEAGAKYRGTIIYLCAKFCNKKMVKYFVELGLDVNVRNYKEMTTLHYAAINGDLEVIKYLINEKKVVHNCRSKKGLNVLHCAAKYGRLDVLKYFIEDLKLDYNNFNTDKYEEWVPLFYAAVAGHLDVLKYLVEEKNVNVDIKNSKGHTALYLATSRNCYIHIIKYLVGKGADVNIITNSKKTILHAAAAKGNIEVIKYYLSVGFNNLHARDIYNNDYLTKAVCYGHLEAAKFFVELKQFDLNITSTSNQSLLDSAIYSRSLAMVAYILQLKPDLINKKNGHGQTPLLLAAKQGTLDIAEHLLKNGADINSQDKYLSTPLHRSILFKQFPMTILLLKYNPNITLKDKNNRKPFQLVQRYDIVYLQDLAKEDGDIYQFVKSLDKFYDGTARYTTWRSFHTR